MRTLVGMIANQQPFLPKYTQQVVKATFEYFNYAGSNWGIMFKGEASEVGSSSNVSDKFSFGEHMKDVPNNDRDKVYYSSFNNGSGYYGINEAPYTSNTPIYMIRVNSYFTGTFLLIGNEPSYYSSSNFNPAFNATVFGEIELKYGKALRKPVVYAHPDTGNEKHHIGPTPEGIEPTSSSLDANYRIVPSGTRDLTETGYVNFLNSPDYQSRSETVAVTVTCPSPYFCPSQGHISWDSSKTISINSANARNVLTVGDTEDMFIYYKGVATY